jgi:hypothetical protein
MTEVKKIVTYDADGIRSVSVGVETSPFCFSVSLVLVMSVDDLISDKSCPKDIPTKRKINKTGCLQNMLADWQTLVQVQKRSFQSSMFF